MPIPVMGKKKPKKQNPKKPQGTGDRFMNMMDWVMDGMDKEPKNEREMIAQGFGAIGKTLVLISWVYAKTFGFIIRKTIGGIKMVLGRDKRKDKTDKNSPAFANPAIEQQMNEVKQQVQQMHQQGQVPAVPISLQGVVPNIPTEFPAQPHVPVEEPMESLMNVPAQLPTQPPAQLPTQPPAQPPTQPPAQPPTQPPAQPPTQPPAQPVVQSPAQPVPSVGYGLPHQDTSEQLLTAFIKIAENLQSVGERLTALEAYATANDFNLDDIYERLNMIQGVQPSSKNRIRFRR